MAFVEFAQIPILQTTIDNININNFTTAASVITTNSTTIENQNIGGVNVDCDCNGMKAVHIISDEILHTSTIDLQNVHKQKKKYKIIEIKI